MGSYASPFSLVSIFPKVSTFVIRIVKQCLHFWGAFREFYQMQVSKMSYGNGMLSFDGRVGKVLFDTGSSYTYFPNKAYSQLVKSVSYHIMKPISTFS